MLILLMGVLFIEACGQAFGTRLKTQPYLKNRDYDTFSPVSFLFVLEVSLLIIFPE